MVEAGVKARCGRREWLEGRDARDGGLGQTRKRIARYYLLVNNKITSTVVNISVTFINRIAGS